MDRDSPEEEIKLGETILSGRDASVFQDGPRDPEATPSENDDVYDFMRDLELSLTPAGG